MASPEPFPMTVFVPAQRRRGFARLGTQLVREGGCAGDGHAGALAEQRDAVRCVADEDCTAPRPGVGMYSADGVEVEVFAIPNTVEKLGHSPFHVAVGVDHELLVSAYVLVTVVRPRRAAEDEGGNLATGGSVRCRCR